MNAEESASSDSFYETEASTSTAGSSKTKPDLFNYETTLQNSSMDSQTQHTDTGSKPNFKFRYVYAHLKINFDQVELFKLHLIK